MNWVRHGGNTTFETKSSYCHAKVEFNSINWVRHGSSTTFETGPGNSWKQSVNRSQCELMAGIFFSLLCRVCEFGGRGAQCWGESKARGALNEVIYGEVSSRGLISLSFIYTILDIPTLSYTSSLKKVPLLGGTSPHRPLIMPLYGVTPPPFLSPLFPQGQKKKYIF